MVRDAGNSVFLMSATAFGANLIDNILWELLCSSFILFTFILKQQDFSSIKI